MHAASVTASHEVNSHRVDRPPDVRVDRELRSALPAGRRRRRTAGRHGHGDGAGSGSRDRATLVVAGEPEGCSGKCNAVAAGLERVTRDIVVLTDDDVPRDPDWLERFEAAVRDHGAVTGTPLFAHTGGTGRLLAWLYEPAQALVALLMLLWGDGCWGGACGFHRQHVDDEDALVADLRRTVTDDLLVGEHLTVDRDGDRSFAAVVPVASSVTGFLDRAVRHVLSFRYFEPGSQWASVLMGVGQALALAVAPVPAAAVMLLGGLGVYAALGARRWTAVFAPVSLLLNALVTLYALGNPEFEWAGRTYRWTGTFDVEIRR